MNIRRLLVLTAATLIFPAAQSYAGPCSKQILETQVRIDARLNSEAAAGPGAKETIAATDHRQPTPKSIAAAEVNFGDVSQKKAQVVGEAMARARKADLAGDRTDCEQALAEAQRALGD
jgi:hypothetical protein